MFFTMEKNITKQEKLASQAKTYSQQVSRFDTIYI